MDVVYLGATNVAMGDSISQCSENTKESVVGRSSECKSPQSINVDRSHTLGVDVKLQSNLTGCEEPTVVSAEELATPSASIQLDVDFLSEGVTTNVLDRDDPYFANIKRRKVCALPVRITHHRSKKRRKDNIPKRRPKYEVPRGRFLEKMKILHKELNLGAEPSLWAQSPPLTPQSLFVEKSGVDLAALDVRMYKKCFDIEPQGESFGSFSSQRGVFMYVNSFFRARTSSYIPQHILDVGDIAINALLFLEDFSSHRTWKGATMALARYIKYQTPLSECIDSMEFLFICLLDAFQDSLTPQGDVSGVSGNIDWRKFEMPDLTGLSEALSDYKTFIKSAYVGKATMMINYLVAFGVLQKFGMPVDSDVLKQTRFREFVKGRSLNSPILMHDFIIDLLDFVTETLTRGIRFIATGSYDAFLFSNTKSHSWAVEARDLCEHYDIPGYVSSVDEFLFLERVQEKLEEGKLLKAALALTKLYEHKMVDDLLRSLRKMEGDLSSRVNCLKSRPQPFGLYVVGGSNIGKSYLTRVLFHAYAKFSTMNGVELPSEDHYMYLRNSRDDYWSAFKPSMWCVVADDIADKLPVPGVEDKSINELLHVLNICPLLTNQADLSDKGRIPMRARLFIATGNSPDCGVTETQYNPYAFWRRFNYRIIPTLKEGKTTLRGAVSEGEGFDNHWIFTVEECVPVAKPEGPGKTFKKFGTPQQEKSMRQHAEWRTVGVYDDIDDFIAWYGSAIAEHLKNTAQMEDRFTQVGKVEICEICYRSNCACGITPQGEQFDAPPERKFRENLNLPWHLAILYWVVMSFLWLNVMLNKLAMYGVSYLIRNQRPGTPDDPTGYSYHFIRRLYFRCLRKAKRWLNSWSFASYGWYNTVEHWFATASYAGVFNIQRLAYVIAFLFFIKKMIEFARSFYQHEAQGTSFVKPEIFEEEEKVTVWQDTDFSFTKFDVSSRVTSRKNMSIGEQREYFSSAVYSMTMFSNKGQVIHAQAVQLAGQIFCTAAHYFRHNRNNVAVEVYRQNAHANHRRKRKIKFKDIYFPHNTDLAFFQMSGIPPGKDLSHHLMKDDANFTTTATLTLRRRGLPVIHLGIHKTHTIRRTLGPDYDNLVSKIWAGYNPGELTEVGDCGGLMWSHMERVGPVILGIHIGAREKDKRSVASFPITQEIWRSVQRNFDNQALVSVGTTQYIPDTKKVVQTPHQKSPIRYIPQGTFTYYGAFPNVYIPAKSHVGRTFLGHKFVAGTVDSDYPITDGFGPPRMRTYHVRRNPLMQMTQTNEDMDVGAIGKCADAYTNDILNFLNENELKLLHPIDQHVAINGFPGINYIDPINKRTSTGWPYNTTKLKYLIEIPPEEPYDICFEVAPEIQSEIERIEEAYAHGERAHPVFKAHMKDEPLPNKKIEANKTRIFSGAPLAFVIVMRKYLLSFVRVMQRNRFVFEAGVGMTVQTAQWDDLYHHLTKFGEDRIVCGDYSKYDKKMAPDVILAAFRVIRQVCSRGAYSEEDLKIIDCIAYDIAFPVTDYFGDLVGFIGTNPSGHPLTVVINSIVNSLYMRYAYVLCTGKDAREFQLFVSLMTYGDDNIMGISVERSDFNHTAIAQALANIGVVYTMADKEAESVPFLNINSASFLKRSWRCDEELEKWVCPIEHDTICKMLTTCLKSTTYDAMDHMACVVETALSEYFWYGRDVFEDRQHQFRRIIDGTDLDNEMYQKFIFKSYDFYRERYLKASGLLEQSTEDGDGQLVPQGTTFSDAMVAGEKPYLGPTLYGQPVSPLHVFLGYIGCPLILFVFFPWLRYIMIHESTRGFVYIAMWRGFWCCVFAFMETMWVIAFPLYWMFIYAFMFYLCRK